MLYQGKILTSSVFANLVGVTYQNGENAFVQVVNPLRRKLGQTDDNVIVQRIWDTGYRLTTPNDDYRKKELIYSI